MCDINPELYNSIPAASEKSKKLNKLKSKARHSSGLSMDMWELQHSSLKCKNTRFYPLCPPSGDSVLDNCLEKQLQELLCLLLGWAQGKHTEPSPSQPIWMSHTSTAGSSTKPGWFTPSSSVSPQTLCEQKTAQGKQTPGEEHIPQFRRPHATKSKY